MVKPQAKRSTKKVLADVAIRKAVRKAVREGRTNIVIDAKPCSLEVSKSTSGIIAWKVKIYSADAGEVLDSVSKVKRIREKIDEHFGS
jgi:hypothetical protein